MQSTTDTLHWRLPSSYMSLMAALESYADARGKNLSGRKSRLYLVADFEDTAAFNQGSVVRIEPKAYLGRSLFWQQSL